MKRVLASLLLVAVPAVTQAANPAQVSIGQELFTQEYASTTPGLNGDGLGPVFNESSCVACHNVGGVGGSGDVSKNARSLGLNEGIYRRPELPAQLTATFASFSPGFLNPDGTVKTSFPMHRRGGSAAFDQLRNQSMSIFNAQWNIDDVASTDSVHAERVLKKITNPSGNLTLSVQVFARNTTPLFGLGLIDQIPESTLWQLTRQQRGDQEISGRPGTLSDGRLGKFGWRANFATLLEFNENACSAELGLQSKRVKQPRDLLNRSYINANPDITDEAIHAMNAFVASLPRPNRELPSDSKLNTQIGMGEQRFAAIGCAKCHVPNLGGVADLYSDLLLHDMGPYSIDLAGAPAYFVNYEIGNVELSRSETTKVKSETTMLAGTYYGQSYPASTSITASESTVHQGNANNIAAIVSPIKRVMRISTPQYVANLKQGQYSSTYETLDSPQTRTQNVNGERGLIETKETIENSQSMRFNISRTVDKTQTITTQLMAQRTFERTNTIGEWKTPPLWGVRDSAPYMHDGRAETILEAIAMHDGEGRGTRNRFFALSYNDQQAILAFLDTFVAPKAGVIEAPKKFTRRDLAAGLGIAKQPVADATLALTLHPTASALALPTF